jgi:release factor glutamine methyltransferase
MNNQSIQEIIHLELKEYFTHDELRAFLFWILPHFQSNPQYSIDELHRIIDELKSGKPIQYIFQIAFFGQLELKVTPDTLIPRPETEELCDLICSHFNKSEGLNSMSRIKGIDLGTGSGCIPMYLLTENKNWQFTGIDISEGALNIANFNAKKLGVGDRFSSSNENILHGFSLPSDIQLLVSNPPYISELERGQMSERVLMFEPEQALFTPSQDPLEFYKKIAELVPSSAIHTLSIWLEINQYFDKEIKALFSTLGDTEILNDISGNPRFLHCEYRKLF